MSPAVTIALFWVGFSTTHIVLSSTRVRPRLVARMGQGAYLGLFSLVAAVFLIPATRVYFASKATSVWLWAPDRGPLLSTGVYLLVGLGVVFMAASFANPRGVGRKEVAPGGIYRITRHPLVMGIGLWAAAHLIPNGRAVDVAWFGGFAVFAVIGCWHQDRRKLAGGDPAFRALHDATPFWPFAGGLSETARGVRELQPWVVAIGIAAAVALRLAHDPWLR